MREALETWGDTATLAQRLHWHIHQALRSHSACSVLVVRPLEPLTSPPARSRGAERSAERQPDLTALAERLSQIVRRDDDIEVHPQQGIGVVLRGAESDGARAVFLRLRDSLTRSAAPSPANGDEVALTLALGYATHPATSALSTQGATLSVEVTLEAMTAAAWEPRVLATVTVPLATPGRPSAHLPRLTPRGARSTRVRDAAEVVAPPPDAAASASDHRHLRLLAAAPTSATEMAALRVRAQTLGVPFATVPARVPAGCRRALDVALARKLQAVPIGRTRGLLTVAMQNPSDTDALSQLEAASGLSIFPVLGAPRDLARALRQWSSPK